MEPVVAALADQCAELGGLIKPLDGSDWERPTPCEGWTVADVVLHLAQTNEMAVASVEGHFGETAAALAGGLPPAATIDEGVDLMVARERGAPPADVRRRWQESATALVSALAGCPPSTRVQWVAGDLAARTLAATRIAETWIHTTDVAEALGVDLEPADRLWYVARLAWRTLPYAFARAGRELHGPVAFHLTAPSGDRWDLVPDGPVTTTITGDGVELCLLAGRRRSPDETGLAGEGPDAEAVLELVRTYA